MLYYSVAHYFDRPGPLAQIKFDNIKNHVEQFQNTAEPNKEFVLVSFVDAPRGDAWYEDVRKRLEAFCLQLLPEKNYHVIVEFNWGGTIAGLWYTYTYLSSAGKEGYVAHMEEDFGPKNEGWYGAAKASLTRGVVYVGESRTGALKSGNDDHRNRHATHLILGLSEVWTEGGFYFSTIERLGAVSDKIGIFHKGRMDTKYDHDIDGISYGEVGFPTLLHHAGFKISVLRRQSYFRGNWSQRLRLRLRLSAARRRQKVSAFVRWKRLR